VNPRALDHLRAEVDQRRLTTAATGVVAACALVVSVGDAWFQRPEALGCAIASAAVVLIAGLAHIEYADTVERLATEPHGAEIRDVDAYLTKVVDHRVRRLVAAWIREVLQEAGQPGSLYLAQRVQAHHHQLRLLARDLESNVTIQPKCMAICARLLTAAAESPLYNPRIPSEQLMSTLLRIRLGIGHRSPDAERTLPVEVTAKQERL
jgi:hypothetical protein